MGVNRNSTLFLDRFEGEEAVVVAGEAEGRLPRGVLPPGAREGDWLSISIQVDEEVTRQRREDIARRREALGEGDDGGDLDL